MHYIIQENTFREYHYDFLVQTLERLELSYTTVRIFPYVDKIVSLADINPEIEGYVVDDLPDFEAPSDKIFIFGAIKLARITKDKGYYPGSMMNNNHNFEVYKNHYKENLLNYDSEILKISDIISWEENTSKFIRPTEDTKSFTGQVFYSSEEWNIFINRQLYNHRNEQFNEDTLIQVSSTKKIFKEIRFWVVGGKVITGSQYRLGSKTILDEYFEQEAQDFAQSMVDIFQLADAFVIDVCLTDNGWKIVECGCINCAGFYKSDLNKIINALENFYL